LEQAPPFRRGFGSWVVALMALLITLLLPSRTRAGGLLINFDYIRDDYIREVSMEEGILQTIG
jgi:hypothetical protein